MFHLKMISLSVACTYSWWFFGVFFLLWFAKGGKGRKAVRTPHPLPHHFFFILGSASVLLNLLLYEPHQKNPPAMQAILKISLMSWTCQGMNIGMYHLNFELFLPLHPKSLPPPPTPPPMDAQILTTSPFLIWTLWKNLCYLRKFLPNNFKTDSF